MLQLVESELANYRVEETMPLNSNPLLWWEANELKYPILSKLAKKYICVPATSVHVRVHVVYIVYHLARIKNH